MPVSSSKGFRLAAMASVGAVFSEMKLSVVPSNWRHSLGESEAAAGFEEPPQPGSVSASAPSPPALSASRRVSPPMVGVMPVSAQNQRRRRSARRHTGCGRRPKRRGSRRMARMTMVAVVATMLLSAVPARADQRTFTLRYGPVHMGGFNVKYPRGSVSVPHADGSIVRMHARLVDARGRRVTIRDVMLHHIVFHRVRRSSITGACTNPSAEPFYGTGEENQSLILPPGYGYPTRAHDQWRMAAMLMSHRLRKRDVFIQYRVTIDDSRALTPVRAFWVRANGCSNGIGYGVSGGGGPGAVSTKRFDWKVPIDGRIVAAGGHLH